jgi:hypothetical protein
MTAITLPPGGDTKKLSEVRTMARELMDQHGLEDWKLTFGRAKFQAGLCIKTKGKEEIRLSAPLMSLWETWQSRDTILHEIAHALTDDGHGPRWKRKCREIGADPTRTWGHLGEAQLEPKPSKYVGTCPRGHETPRSRLPKTRASCSQCSPRFSEKYLITWRLRNV